VRRRVGHPVSMAAVSIVLTVLFGYLFGSIPVARLATRRDLRTVGDGNPGYWNARESVGGTAARLVFVGDVTKGAVAAGLGVLLATDGQWWLGYIGGFAAMVGHAWPVFDRFRGGRSVLCFVGAICVVAPLTALIAIGVLLIVVAATRSFAWGARAGVFAVPFIQLVIDGPYRTAATGALMTLIGVRFAQAAWAGRRSTDPD
jgi:glycerol-3-phosphate acyltransferase PlsY